MCYIYLRLLFGIACLAYHTAIKFALYQLLYPEFIVNSFDIKRAAATFVQFVAHSMANINVFYSGVDIQTLCECIRCELDKLHVWLSVNTLSLNVDNTNFILFGNRKILTMCVYL